MKLPLLLKSYLTTKSLRFSDTASLHQHQRTQLARFVAQTLPKSPYYRPIIHQVFGDLPTNRQALRKFERTFDLQQFAQLPICNKAQMMAHFDQMNTQGLSKQTVLEVALDAEHSRDFSLTTHGISVGLSSGTSGQRGIFAVSEQEQARWAGVMLAKMLPKGLLHGERVALLLRANNNLYRSVRTPFLSFAYFDLLGNFDQLLKDLHAYRPTIIVAPAAVLTQLASLKQAGKCTLSPSKLISCAEVLTASDRMYISEAFGQMVHEVYQATEGFLAATCAHGRLHLNEEFIYLEKRWLDERHFIPIITDFSRQTQPIVRYELDDVLVAGSCTCGSACSALSHIDGRFNDSLKFGDRLIFADSITRIIARTLPIDMPYQLSQNGWHITLHAKLEPALWHRCRQALSDHLTAQGVDSVRLIWHLHPTPPTPDFGKKTRHILCHQPAA